MKENKKPNNPISGGVEPREITQELRESYLDYAMSVIVSRALPDARDGLKPVQRRILWSMWDSGLTHGAKFKKSANVVGEVLGKYHPHGDPAVYEAMVRMAQDFSLRYPLIEGQGNFGCFTKDIKVKLTDGRDLTFEKLVEEDLAGKKNYTYTVNRLGLIAVAEIKNPRLTIKNAELVKVILDNGAEIRCTPNHRFLLKTGSYKEAQELKAGESLMPIYQKLSTKKDRLNRDGYALIYQNKREEWVPVHHLADNYNLTVGKYSKKSGRVRHHADFNKLNNNPDNVIRVGWGEHWKIHYERASQQHKDPKYRQKIAEGRKKFWSEPKNKKRQSEIISERNRKNWRDSIYREKMRRFLSEVNKEYIKRHPEKRQEFSERASQTMKIMWQIPRYRQLFHEKITAANKKRITNATGKVKFLRVCQEILIKSHLLNEKLYNEKRNELYSYGRATSWDTGVKKYFNNDPNLILLEINKNHKVVSVELLKEREDVYDLTIDKTHNFALAAGVFVHNSIDGDSAAAYRYTEARLSRLAEEMLLDIEKETVDWQPNYDGSRLEPKVLPAKLPNLLLNGTVGIAVGMATNIPPHNLVEIADAAAHLIDNPKATVSDLMQFVQGPDFPTGGIIYDKKSITEAYASGRGAITTRALTEVMERQKGQHNIEISEIPYQVNKSELIIKIAELVTEKKIQGIRDVRDESDKDGLRIVIELKNDAAPQRVLNQLFQYTDLQKNFNLNLIALTQNGLQPEVMSLKDILLAYLEHRKEVVRRRAEFELKKAEERAHILTGLHKALGNIDAVITTIKKSKDREDAQKNLIAKFKFTEVQTNAILEMKLQTLAALEREKIEEELKEKKKLIEELQTLLKSPVKILKVVKDELKDAKEKYGDQRRTKVVAGGLKEFSDEDLVPKEETIITMSQAGYIKRVPPSSFRSQKRGGKGLIGSDVAEEDFLSHFISANTHDNLLFFTERGRVFQTKVYEIPEASRVAKGKAIHNFLEIPLEEKVSAVIAYPGELKVPRPQRLRRSEVGQESEKLKVEGYLVMVTKNGVIKKTALQDFTNVRRNGIIALKLKKGDSLRWVRLSSGSDQIILATASGQAIRFKESQIRAMGRTASGVRGIRLKKNDSVVALNIVIKENEGGQLLAVMANGFGKRTPLSQYKVQGRGGSGVKISKVTSKTGLVIASLIVTEEKEILALSARGQIIRTQLESIRLSGRATQGVRIMNVAGGDKVAGVICL